MKTSAFVLAAVSAVLAVGALAQTPAPRSDTATGQNSGGSAPARPNAAPPAAAAQVQFGTVDTNKDGRISRAEAQAHGNTLGGSFATLDADSDTYLSQAEYGKWSMQNQGGAHDGHSTGPTNTMPGNSRSPMDGNATQPGTNAPPRSTSPNTAPNDSREGGARQSETRPPASTGGA